MTTMLRWPLHPRPGEGEALSSWLDRVAGAYGMDAQQLLGHNLGAVSLQLDAHSLDTLDVDPPPGVLTALTERTGVPRAQLHRMMVAGQVPWLLDPMEAEPAPGVGFETYVGQHSVLLAPGQIPHRRVPGWRAWLPTQQKSAPMHRACPVCIDNTAPEARQLTLVSQLPVGLSCPDHGCRLEDMMGIRGAFLSWTHPDTGPTTVPGPVAAMDRRTEEAMRTGIVSLPGRQVHAGVWFRLLRTLIEELSTPISALGCSAQRALREIWQHTGRPLRGGMTRWRPYEALPWPHQQSFLEAAATAMHLINTGQVPAAGTLGALLRSEPHRPVIGGTPPAEGTSAPETTAAGNAPEQGATLMEEPAGYWRQARDSMYQVIAAAQDDPAVASQLLAFLTAWNRTPEHRKRVRQDMITLGVPEHHLPPGP